MDEDEKRLMEIEKEKLGEIDKTKIRIERLEEQLKQLADPNDEEEKDTGEDSLSPESIDVKMVRQAIEKAELEWRQERANEETKASDGDEPISPEDLKKIDDAERALFREKDDEVQKYCNSIGEKKNICAEEFID